MIKDTPDNFEIAARSFYCVLVFTLIAYQNEKLAKQVFLGKYMTQEVSKKWVKVFESFGEGIAIFGHGEL